MVQQAVLLITHHKHPTVTSQSHTTTTHLADGVVGIVEEDQLCVGVELAGQFRRVKFPVLTGDNAALLSLRKHLLHTFMHVCMYEYTYIYLYSG